MGQDLVIPEKCACNKKLTSDAKILFGLIYSNGWCRKGSTISNEYLASYSLLTENEVFVALSLLKDEDYIFIEVNSDGDRILTFNSNYLLLGDDNLVSDLEKPYQHFCGYSKIDKMRGVTNEYMQNSLYLHLIKENTKHLIGLRGCYFLYDWDYELSYIGQSKQLGKRIAESVKTHNAFYFSYIVFQKDDFWHDRLDDFERGLIKSLKPKENKAILPIHDIVKDMAFEYYSNISLEQHYCFTTIED